MMTPYNAADAIRLSRSMDRGKRNDRTPARIDPESLTGADVAMNGWIHLRALHGGWFLLAGGRGSSQCKVPAFRGNREALPPVAFSCTAAVNGAKRKS